MKCYNRRNREATTRRSTIDNERSNCTIITRVSRWFDTNARKLEHEKSIEGSMH